MRVKNTNAFHGSIAVNLVQNISNPRTCQIESTMSPFRCVEIYEQCCDLPTDPRERATFECFSATRRLKGSRRLLAFLARYGALRNNSRLGLFISLAICCIISIAISDNIVTLTNQTHLEPSEHYLPMSYRLGLEV
jgi:hypothetical protein